jgi:hypothetical protein
MQPTRSGSRGRCLPATFRPQGLSTLSTVSSLDGLAGLVSCRQRLWGFPFGAFSSLKVARRYRRCTTRLPLPPISRDEPKPAAPRSLDRLPGAASSESLAPARVFSPTSRRRLPWGSSLSGVVSADLGPRFRRPPPTRLSAGPIAQPGIPRLGVSIDQRLARPRGPSAPFRVFAPQQPWHSAASLTRAYGFAERLAARHRAVRVASQGFAPAS